ncbi:hypothetical protein GW796_07575 [archaeon]|nr:hypothetical protein [archaeon]
MSNILKTKANFLKSFLTKKGYKVKHTECLEALSHLENGSCYNVAKEKIIRILKDGEHLTFKELKEKNFTVDVVINMDMDTIMCGIEAVNEAASDAVTGSDYALCDLSYQVHPYFYGGGVAIRVTGYIEDIETLSHLSDYEEDDDDETDD